MHTHESLCRVITIAGIVKDAGIGTNLRAEKKLETIPLLQQSVVPGSIKTDISAQIANVTSRVLGHGGVSLPECLKGDGTVGKVGCTQRLVNELQLGTTIVQRREIGIKLMNNTNTQERGMGDRTLLGCGGQEGGKCNRQE